jgi:hypothetical protein
MFTFAELSQNAGFFALLFEASDGAFDRFIFLHTHACHASLTPSRLGMEAHYTDLGPDQMSGRSKRGYFSGFPCGVKLIRHRYATRISVCVGVWKPP